MMRTFAVWSLSVLAVQFHSTRGTAPRVDGPPVLADALHASFEVHGCGIACARGGHERYVPLETLALTKPVCSGLLTFQLLVQLPSGLPYGICVRRHQQPYLADPQVTPLEDLMPVSPDRRAATSAIWNSLPGRLRPRGGASDQRHSSCRAALGWQARVGVLATSTFCWLSWMPPLSVSWSSEGL